MKWIKQGLIYAPDGTRPWAKHSALQPTPVILDDELIRVFVGFRDAGGVSRVGFVDVDGANPSRIAGVSSRPALGPGQPGAFDDNGVVPTAAIWRDGRLFLYYAGYQLGHHVRFTVFGGLATSGDRGESLERYRRIPVLDRTEDALLFRVIHSIMPHGDRWRAWYGAGARFEDGPFKSVPVYDIRHMESPDGIHFWADGPVCIPVRGGDEHRVGRPSVIRHDNGYRMFYAVGTRSLGYRLGYAESADGYAWTRHDDDIGITVSASGWDSQMIAYPSVVAWRDRTYLFYNGNNYGQTGFGYAVLGDE